MFLLNSDKGLYSRFMRFYQCFKRFYQQFDRSNIAMVLTECYQLFREKTRAMYRFQFYIPGLQEHFLFILLKIKNLNFLLKNQFFEMFF